MPDFSPEPVLIVVHGVKKAEQLQRCFNSSNTLVISFESAPFIPSRLAAAYIVMDDIKLIGGHKVDKLEAWMDEFVRPRLVEPKTLIYAHPWKPPVDEPKPEKKVAA